MGIEREALKLEAESSPAETDLSSSVEEEPPKIEEIVTPNVIQQIITRYNPDLSLVSWNAELGSNIGDNYMSILYAVDLELKNNKRNGIIETLHVMLKTLPRNIYRQDMIGEMNAFNVETTMYQTVLPNLVDIQKEVSDENVFHAWPGCYAVHLDGHSDYLALENLKVLGYKMGNRRTGLDFNHCSSVLRNLAQYHGLSYVKFGGCREKILETYPTLSNSMFDKTKKITELQRQFFSQSLKTLAESLKEEGQELASSRLDKLSEADACAILEDLRTRDGEWTVITHGDCWVNNIMFRYKETDVNARNPVGVKFIDFQVAVPTSRMLDFYYFLMTSGQLEVLEKREQDLLMIYFAEFTCFVERLGVDTKERGLTWDNLLMEASIYSLYGILMGLLLAPMLTADSADIPNIENMKKEDFQVENNEEAVKVFYKDLTSDFVVQKVNTIVLKYMPKCSTAETFL